MHNLDYSLHYDIASATTGYTLKIWEPVPETDRILYKLQYRLPTEAEAWNLLRILVGYLGSPVTSGGTDAWENDRPSGEIVVRPSPTLNLEHPYLHSSALF